MKKLIALACLGMMFSVPAFAGAQQDKMKTCNADAKEKALKGDERKAFMKDCLSKKAEAPAAEKKTEAAPADKKAEAAPGGKKPSQHQKMSICNQNAKEKALKGDERKKFMSDCLKG